jgi:hypothetical protein
MAWKVLPIFLNTMVDSSQTPVCEGGCKTCHDGTLNLRIGALGPEISLTPAAAKPDANPAKLMVVGPSHRLSLTETDFFKTKLHIGSCANWLLDITRFD